ncbi:MAG: translocation/assembly module TamB domain-containing protein [Prolixibacteraceae bacterium]|nr:translocation/assembly module TamB domain-containing protein [Prolixibacteraceae bacterium]
MKRVLRYIFIIIGWLFIGVIALLLIAGLLIQTSPVQKKLARIAETQASQVVNGNIIIGGIGGNFFTNLTLENVLWNFQNDTLVYIKSFNTSYRLLPLLHGELVLQSVRITEPYFQLKQENDSVWNVQNLVPGDGENETDNTKTSGNFRFIISDLKLEEGMIKIHSADTIIPKKINHINLNAALEYDYKHQLIQLKEMAFQTHQPGFTLVQLSMDAERNSEFISMGNFHLKTVKNAFDGQATYLNEPPLDLSAEIESEPVNLDEFEFFIPGFKLSAKPEINFNTKTVDGKQEVFISLTDNDQILSFKVVSDNFSSFITDTKGTLLHYQITGDIENVDLAHWLGNPELNYQVTGKINLDGAGINPETANVNLTADFWDCLLAEQPVDELKMKLQFNHGDLSGNISGNGNFGMISIEPEIRNLLTNPNYDLSIITQKLNLAPLLGNDSLQSDINLIAEISGESFVPADLKATADIVLERSEFFDFVVDSLEGNFSFNKNNITIDSLWLMAQAIQLKASGNYNLKGNSDVNLWAEIDSIQPFWKYIPVDSLFAQGIVNAHLWGTPDSLLLNTNIDLQQIRFPGLTAESIRVEGDGKLAKGDTTFSATVFAAKFNTGNFVLDSISTSAEYYTDSLWVKAHVAGEEISSSLVSGISLGETIRIELTEWGIDFKDQHLELVQAPAIIVLDSQQYSVSNFKMVSSLADSAQFITANGIISRNANEDFNIEISNVDISELLESIGQKYDVAGKFNITAQLQGNAANPELLGSLFVDDALAYGYRFSELGGDFNFENNRLNFQGQIIPLVSGKFDLSASMPLSVRIDSMDFEINREDSISGKVVIDSFPLSVFQFLEEGEQIKGVLNGKVDVGGTLNSPRPVGNLSLENAEVIIPEYGIEYRDIILDLSFSENAAQLDSFYIKSDDGDLKASGTVDFNTALYKGDINQSDISIQFNKFNPFDHRQFNMELSGDVSLKGKAGEVVFGGNLTVPEAEVYLPAIMNMTGRITAPEIPEPLLVREIELLNMQNEYYDIIQPDTAITTNDSLNINYLEGFTGKLNIKFPSNTWIKNKDMFIEISGDIDLIKNAEFFELFGTIDIVRGQYDLLGKRFKIQEGTLTFQGGEEIIPRINITADYTFRNSDRAEQELQVVITGIANNPVINFTLDGNTVSEGDALSYLFFGRGMNELTVEQQENVSGVGQLAGNAAMSVLSSQLTDLLGRSLNVDYIEVKGDGDFDNATVVVGKYITNDLFVSYEQRFGEIDEKEMAKYEVKLEYELFRFLFLQLNNSSNDSGFDVIFKLNSK